MPTYRFYHEPSDSEWDEMMSNAEREQYLKDNPDVEQVHTGINIVAGVGSIKSDSGWKIVSHHSSIMPESS